MTTNTPQPASVAVTEQDVLNACKLIEMERFVTADEMRRVLEQFAQSRAQTAAPVAVGEPTLRNAVAQVCEGWTLPEGVRKILETALYATPAAGAGGSVGAHAVAVLKDILDEVDADPPSHFTQIDDDLLPRVREIVAKYDATPAPEQATTGSGDSGSVHLGSGECGNVQAPEPRKSLNAKVADLLRPFLKDGQKVIWREPFRWHDDNGVLPNHYDGFNLPGLCADFDYEIDHDFDMHHAAIVSKKGSQ